MSSASLTDDRVADQPTVLGHPAGLYTLFFAEMWERFSYYGMRALLVFYMIKGFLGYGDTQAYSVYGAYTALVYMTPFIGGLLADKILGQRLAVVIGGLLMAAGHLLMTIESDLPFFFALALLITGNGFFKPNISTTVGSLYAAGDKRRDDGFNIFYTGINLGAAISPLLCGFVGETYGWHYGFGLATIGMLVGLAVFVMPNLVTSFLIFTAAAASTVGMLVFRPDNFWAISINVFVGVCLMVAAVIACRALGKGGLPAWAGARPEGMNSRHDWKIYVGIVISIPVFAALVSGFTPFTNPPEPKKDELTGEVVPQDTPRQKHEKQIAKLEKLGVEQAVIDEVAKGFQDKAEVQRGEPFKLLPKSFIKDFKREADDRTKATIMRVMLTRAGEVPGAESTKKQLGLQMHNAGLKWDGEADFAADEKNDVVAALSTEFDTKFSEDDLEGMGSVDGCIAAVNKSRGTALTNIVGMLLEEVSKPAGLVLTVLGLLAFGYLIIETFKLQRIARDRMLAALVLIFFQMLFFAFFEQAGSSVNNFTDRNIDRVGESQVVAEGDVGETIRLTPTQAQLGFEREGDVFSLADLDELRKIVKEHDEVDALTISWPVTDANKGMGIAGQLDELPASIFQAFNAIFILIFAVAFNWLWSILRRIRLDPPAPVKFGLGLIQLGLGFGAFYMGAQNSNEQGMVSMFYLTLGILLQTTGELCLSPVGLSTMTKLSPKVLVSTLMGAWFLATAFSQYLAAIISQFTSVGGHGASASSAIPTETVHVYGDVFYMICWTAVGCGVACLVLSPLLTYWMHQNEPAEPA